MVDLSRYSDKDIINIISSDAEAELRKRGYDYGWYKKETFAGVIYILVNPAFPDLVKIGYADNVAKRLKTLNSNSGLPDPFHCYALYKVKKRLEDLRLHGLIDTLDSTLRHAKNREFFEMSAEKAFSILSAIAQINGDEEQLVKNPFDDDFFVTDKEKVVYQKPLSDIQLLADSRDKQTISNCVVPDGEYYLNKNITGFGSVKGVLSVKNGNLFVKKGSICAPAKDSIASDKRKNAIIKNNVLQEDVECSSFSIACLIVMGYGYNGWYAWKNVNGQPIDVYRKNNKNIVLDVQDNNIIPDGEYYFKRNKGIEKRILYATAIVKDGSWTLLKGSMLGVLEQTGIPQNVKDLRSKLSLDSNGKLLNDVEVGKCSPSFIGTLILNRSCNGWLYWFTKDGQLIDVFRKNKVNNLNNIKNNNLLSLDKLRFKYWSTFCNYVSKNDSFTKEFSLRKPSGRMYYDFSIGSSECHFALAQKRQRSTLYICLWIHSDKYLYDKLYGYKDIIESNFDFKLNWEQSAERKSCAIGYEKFVNYDDKSSWNSQFDWVIETLLKMKVVFEKYIKELK